MGNIEGPRAEVATVVNLEEFRNRVRPTPAPEEEKVSEYTFVDDPTFQAVRRVYDVINGGMPAHGFSVYEREVTDSPSAVWVTRDPAGGEHFAIDKQPDELEALTIDFDVHSQAETVRLRPVIERTYCASLVTRALMKVRYPVQNFVESISPPRIGDTELHLSAKDKEQQDRWLSITRWRVASGVGLMAATHQRKDLHTQSSRYLAEVIKGRYQYFLAMQMAERLFGRLLPDEEDTFSDFLTGMCNPLNRFEIKKVLNASQPAEPTPATDSRS